MIPVHLIDDDEIVSNQVKEFLLGYGFDVTLSKSAEEGIQALEIKKPHILLLDVMLPGMDGFDALQKIRRKFNIPVIMLTARSDVFDRILGLEIGADDYITKPFEPRELIARIKSVLKRVGRGLDERIVSCDINIDQESRVVTISNSIIELTTMEYELILMLVSNPGRKYTRDEIISRLQGQESEAYGRSIDNLISRVRKKIEKLTSASCIETVWGTGYMYVEGKSGKAEK